jgi:N-acetylneuraminate synthase
MMGVKFVCEVGYNHTGDIDKACEIIDAFNFCDVFKFQKMHPKTFLTKERYNSKSSNNGNYFDPIYGKHREHLELPISDHTMLRDYIRSMGKEWACSVHDIPSAKDIIPLDPYYLKIASGRCNHFGLIDYCLKNYKGVLHVSTGMTSRAERQAVRSKSNNILIYSCTSDYSGTGNIYIEGNPGFSCHAPDIFYAKAAILNGAKFIEYHCTISRDWPGTDNKISLLPYEYQELVEWYQNNRERIDRIRHKKPIDVPACEMPARKKTWSTV